jgi:hypothetical protein
LNFFGRGDALMGEIVVSSESSDGAVHRGTRRAVGDKADEAGSFGVKPSNDGRLTLSAAFIAEIPRRFP